MAAYYHKNLFAQAPSLIVIISMGLGIVLSRYCLGTINPWWLFLVAFVFSAASLAFDFPYLDSRKCFFSDELLKKREASRKVRMWFIAFVPFFVGVAVTQAEVQRIVVDWSPQPATFVVEVDNVNKTYDDAVQLDATVQKGENAGKRIRLYLQGLNGRKVYPGNCLVAWTQMSKPHNAGNPYEFDYVSYLTNHGISGTAYCRKGSWKCLDNKSGGTLKARLLTFRDKLVEKFSLHFDGESLAVLAAMTLGNKTYLDKPTRQLFAETGSSHILALSGLHVGILFSLFNMTVIRSCRRRKTMVAASLLFVASLWVFTMMCGMSPSLVRASFMMTVMQLNSCLHRETHCLGNLIFTALLMLSYSPLMLFDVSFQLSFGAVLCIALYIEYMQMVWLPVPTRSQKRSPYFDYRIKNPYYRIRTWLGKHFYKTYVLKRRAFLNFLCISLAAQLGTMPLVVYYFHLISPYAILANFVVIPLSYFILGFTFLFFVVPFAQPVIAVCLQFFLDVLFKCLSTLSALPGASIEWHANEFTLFCVVVIVVCYMRHKWFPYRRLAVRCMKIAVFLGCACEAFDWRPMRATPGVWVYNEPRTAAVHFVSSARSSYLVSSLPADSALDRLTYVSDNFWKRTHMQTPHVIGERFANKEIMRLGGLVQFGGNRFLWLNTNKVSWRKDKKVPLDVLVVSRGCSLRADQLLQALAPRRVVLDSSLSEYRRTLLKNEFAALHFRVHDVAEQGAFCFTLDRT